MTAHTIRGGRPRPYRILPLLLLAALAPTPVSAHDPAPVSMQDSAHHPTQDPLPPASRVTPAPGPGSNEMLRAPITIAEGLEVIISDVLIPPNATVPRHYHPGEEFLYVIQGSSVHVEEGRPDRVLRAGDAYVIPPRAEHAPRAGPEGARAIVFRVHVAGQPERIPVPEPDGGAEY